MGKYVFLFAYVNTWGCYHLRFILGICVTVLVAKNKGEQTLFLKVFAIIQVKSDEGFN